METLFLDMTEDLSLFCFVMAGVLFVIYLMIPKN